MSHHLENILSIYRERVRDAVECVRDAVEIVKDALESVRDAMLHKSLGKGVAPLWPFSKKVFTSVKKGLRDGRPREELRGLFSSR